MPPPRNMQHIPPYGYRGNHLFTTGSRISPSQRMPSTGMLQRGMQRSASRGMRNSSIPGARNGSGLLSKLFNRGQVAQTNQFLAGTSRSSTVTNGGLLKTLADPNLLNGFLSNSQKVLNGVQQLSPMVQQYGPMIRNIPSLWRLYKGFKDLPDASEEKTDTENKSPLSANVKMKSDSKQDVNRQEIQAEEREKSETTPVKGASIPKLYI